MCNWYPKQIPLGGQRKKFCYIWIWKWVAIIFNQWNCSRQCRSREQTHMSRRVLWLIFNLRIKKIGSSFTSFHKSIISLDQHEQFIHTWATKRCQHCSEWVHSCSSLKADWAFKPTTWHEGLRLLPMLMAWLSYFQLGLPRLHALSRLTMSPPSVDGTLYTCLHTLLMVTVWLDYPRFWWLAGSSWVYTCTHTLLQIIMMGQQ
jgi:hypothetical protein